MPGIVAQGHVTRIVIGSGLILLVPLVLTLLGSWEWHQPGVYVLAFVLLTGSGLAYEQVATRTNSKAYRVGVGLAVGTAFVLGWVNMVRVAESERLADLMYYGALGVGVTGAVVARFQPLGMSRALLATAFTQVLVPVMLLVFWRQSPPSGGALGYAGSAFFTMLFIASALLFRRAGANARTFTPSTQPSDPDAGRAGRPRRDGD